MIGSRNRGRLPFRAGRSLRGWRFHACRAEHGICDLHTLTHKTAQKHPDYPRKAAPPRTNARAPRASDSVWKMDHRVWQIKPPRIDTKCAHPRRVVGGIDCGDWLFCMSDSRCLNRGGSGAQPILASYWYRCFVCLLRARATPFIFCQRDTMLLVAGFFPVRQRRNYEMFQCATGFFFFFPLVFHTQLTKKSPHKPSITLLVPQFPVCLFFFYISRKMDTVCFLAIPNNTNNDNQQKQLQRNLPIECRVCYLTVLIQLGHAYVTWKASTTLPSPRCTWSASS